MPQNEDSPLAFMVFVGAGSVIGGILSQMLFPPQCEIPEKTEKPPTETTPNNETTEQKPIPEPINE